MLKASEVEKRLCIRDRQLHAQFCERDSPWAPPPRQQHVVPVAVEHSGSDGGGGALGFHPESPAPGKPWRILGILRQSQGKALRFQPTGTKDTGPLTTM